MRGCIGSPDVQEEGLPLQCLDAPGRVRGRPVRSRISLGQQHRQLLYVEAPPVRHVILRHCLDLQHKADSNQNHIAARAVVIRLGCTLCMSCTAHQPCNSDSTDQSPILKKIQALCQAAPGVVPCTGGHELSQMSIQLCKSIDQAMLSRAKGSSRAEHCHGSIRRRTQCPSEVGPT